MTREKMLIEMQSRRGFRAFGVSKVQRLFGIGHGAALDWIGWLIETGAAERIDDRPWEVRLL